MLDWRRCLAEPRVVGDRRQQLAAADDERTDEVGVDDLVADSDADRMAVHPDNNTAPLPAVDDIPVQVGEAPTEEVVTPTYPVIQYGHDPSGGDSIGSGFVYNGTAIPSLRRKYIFTDLTTGRIWYADYKDMLTADDGKRRRWRRSTKCASAGTIRPIHRMPG